MRIRVVLLLLTCILSPAVYGQTYNTHASNAKGRSTGIPKHLEFCRIAAEEMVGVEFLFLSAFATEQINERQGNTTVHDGCDIRCFYERFQNCLGDCYTNYKRGDAYNCLELLTVRYKDWSDLSLELLLMFEGWFATVDYTGLNFTGFDNVSETASEIVYKYCTDLFYFFLHVYKYGDKVVCYKIKLDEESAEKIIEEYVYEE